MVRLLPRAHHIYCDESRTSGDRFMVYGGIVLTARDIRWFDDLMATWRAKHKMFGELKWEKVSNRKSAEYRSLIDFYFKHRWRESLHFKSMVCDTQSADYLAFRKENKELGYYKLYYYFLLKKFGPYAQDNDHSLFVYIDQRSTKYKLSDLRRFLNLGIRKEQPFIHRDVVHAVERRDSKRSNAIQLADVLMGAIGWHMNDLGMRPNANRAKNDLADYLASGLKVRSLRDQIPDWRQPLFEKWHFKFTGEKRPGV